MAVQPFYTPKFRAFDADGEPLAGGLLYTYAAGTSTPLATYTTRAGTVANTNPVVLNANGEADVWTTAGVDYKFELRDSAGVVQWTVDNVPSPATADTDTSSEVTTDPGGRLSLTSATPVTTSDVTGATTIYYVPHKHNKVPLYDGSNWALQSVSTELSQTTADTTKSPAAVANTSNYDLFVWNDGGTLRLSRGPAWSSDTSRGTGVGTTELERKDGRWVNKVSITNGPASQRGLYVGTVRSDGSAQINDSMAKRHVWNCYNRAPRPMRVSEATSSWSYNTATWRQANAAATNQIDVVIGQSEDPVETVVTASALTSGSVDRGMVSIGLDATNAPASGCQYQLAGNEGAGGVSYGMTARWRGFPGLGRHYLSWIERGAAAGGGVLWFSASASGPVSGIQGEVWG